jgi:hypothetical protein
LMRVGIPRFHKALHVIISGIARSGFHSFR